MMRIRCSSCRKSLLSFIIVSVLVASSCVIASSSSSLPFLPSSSSSSFVRGGGGGNDDDDAGMMILRVRLSDGSIERLQIPSSSTTKDTMTLKEALSTFFEKEEEDNNKVQIGSSVITDTAQPLSSLGLKHGSLITILPSKSSSNKVKTTISSKSSRTSKKRYDPYPDLAKNYEKALHKTRSRRGSRGSLSYGDIADLQSSLHIVEPQSTGNIKRCYMCRIVAERFQSNGFVTTTTVTKKKDKTTSLSKKKPPKKETVIHSRIGLLLGNVNRERSDLKPKKARTSLSSLPSDREYCNVIKVHALWEPPTQKSSSSSIYDSSDLLKWDESDEESSSSSSSQGVQRVIQIASYLGLKPVGWIFSYIDKRHDNDDSTSSSSSRRKRKNKSQNENENTDSSNEGSLPVWGYDVKTGATLQICNMKQQQQQQQSDSRDDDGSKFVTLAMDGNTGATEAFQLSDVTVQMVSEDNLVLSSDKKKNSRYVPTKHSILVDGKETNILDSVLCLINTAMLSHEGLYSGGGSSSSSKTPSPSIKKNGLLTNKTKKRILSAIVSSSSDNNDSGSSDAKLLQILSDFNIILSLDTLLSNDKDDDTIMIELCTTIKKYVRGQKRGTKLSNKLKLLLQSILET